MISLPAVLSIAQTVAAWTSEPHRTTSTSPEKDARCNVALSSHGNDPRSALLLIHHQIRRGQLDVREVPPPALERCEHVLAVLVRHEKRSPYEVELPAHRHVHERGRQERTTGQAGASGRHLSAAQRPRLHRARQGRPVLVVQLLAIELDEHALALGRPAHLVDQEPVVAFGFPALGVSDPCECVGSSGRAQLSRHLEIVHRLNEQRRLLPRIVRAGCQKDKKDRNSNRITCRGRAQGGVSGWPAGAGEALGRRASGQSTVGHRDDRRVSVTVLGEPGKAWPSSPWEGLGKHRGESAPAYQLRRWSKTNSGTGAGASSQLASGSGAWSHSGGPRARATSGGVVGSPRCPRIVFTAGGR